MGSIVAVRIPLTRLNNIVSTLGIDRRQFHDGFRQVSTSTGYPIVYGGGETVRRRMLVSPNSFALPKTGKAGSLFVEYAARVLIPDRIWWDTAHVVALYCEEPVLSNIFYALNLKTDGDNRVYAEKSLVLWLNTTWGILTILFNRQETRGRWTSLKMAQWRLLPVLDVRRLESSSLRRIASVFDKYKSASPRRIPEQFDPKDPDPVRTGIDRDFLRALKPSLDEVGIEKALLGVYRRVHAALKLWIKE